MEYLNKDNKYCVLRLNTIQSHSDDSFFDYDMKNHVTYLTEYGVKAFGMPKAVVNMPESFANEFILSEDREKFLDMYKRLYETHEEVGCLYRLRDGNGTIHYDDVTMIPVSDELALGYVKDITDKKMLEEQLDMMRHLLTIESLLISTHRQGDNMKKALVSLTDFLGCLAGFIFDIQSETHLSMQCSHVLDDYLRMVSDIAASRAFPRLPQLVESLSKGHTICFNDESIEQSATMYPNLHKLFKSSTLKNLYLLPIMENGQKIVAFIALATRNEAPANEYFLRLVSLSFSRAYDNITEQKKINYLSSYDLSTKLLNRNMYIEYFTNFNSEGVESLGVVEFDVNELHEFNNANGHAAGDQMLRQVADTLRLHFGDQIVFRTGGDEFVAICKNEPENSVMERIKRVQKDLGEQSIFVSGGMCFRTSDFDIEAMNREADKEMYKDKDAFYSSRRSKR